MDDKTNRAQKGNNPHLTAIAAAITLLVLVLAVFAAIAVSALGAMNRPAAQAPATTSASTTDTTTSTSDATTTTEPQSAPASLPQAANPPTASTTTTAATSTSTTLAAVPTTIPPQYAGKGYRQAWLHITIPSPHCEQALISSLKSTPGIVSMRVKRGQQERHDNIRPEKDNPTASWNTPRQWGAGVFERRGRMMMAFFSQSPQAAVSIRRFWRKGYSQRPIQ